MIKGFICSLISAAVFFAAGAMSVAIIGSNDDALSVNETVTMEREGGTYVNVDEKVSGNKTWIYRDCKGLSKVNLDVSTLAVTVEPSTDGSMSVEVSTKKFRSVSVDIECNSGSVDIKLKNGFFITFGDPGSAVIKLPDYVYEKLSIDLGSGNLDVNGISARKNELDIGSGKLEFSQAEGFSADELTVDIGSGYVNLKEARANRCSIDMGSGKLEADLGSGFTAENLEVDIGSGSLTLTNAASLYYNIDMGSGTFNVSGLSGSGEIDVSSGSGKASFINAGGSNSFSVSSGSLDVFLPDDTTAVIGASVSTGSISIDCGGVKERLTSGRDELFTLGGGSQSAGNIKAHVSSGRISFKDTGEQTVLTGVILTNVTE